MRLFLFACAALAAVVPNLGQVGSIYIMPMSNGMDQFLANRLTHFGKFQVVADPKAADAVLTDRLGEAFEAKLEELYPQPKPAKESDKDKGKDKADEPLFKGDRQMRPSFSRGKGTFFIVDRKSRAVLWSTYEPPKNTTADELNKSAERIVKRLKQDLEPKTGS